MLFSRHRSIIEIDMNYLSNVTVISNGMQLLLPLNVEYSDHIPSISRCFLFFM